jgi:hypothetical protein
MRMIKVKSSTLQKIGYDFKTRRLRVEFLNGSIYEYYDVPWLLAGSLLKAESIGRFYNLHIRDQYFFRLISESKAA